MITCTCFSLCYSFSVILWFGIRVMKSSHNCVQSATTLTWCNLDFSYNWKIYTFWYSCTFQFLPLSSSMHSFLHVLITSGDAYSFKSITHIGVCRACSSLMCRTLCFQVFLHRCDYHDTVSHLVLYHSAVQTRPLPWLLALSAGFFFKNFLCIHIYGCKYLWKPEEGIRSSAAQVQVFVRWMEVLGIKLVSSLLTAKSSL